MLMRDWVAGAEGRIETPWGLAQGAPTPIAPGIFSVSTASHGGIWLDDQRLSQVPEHFRAWAKRWAHGADQWFEEDCCWATVACTWPAFFPEEQVSAARKIIAHYFPESVHTDALAG
jgi:hypothetical protein